MQSADDSALARPSGEAARRRARRTAWLCGLIAAAFYLGFIIMTLLRGWK
jgi:hypothetical protein